MNTNPGLTHPPNKGDGTSKRLLHPIPESREMLGGISHTKFYDMVKCGEIHIVKIGSRSFITDQEIHRVVDNLSGSDRGQGAAR